ncbi:MAG: molybdenum cofactor biosynthesis protein MoaD [Gemmatimonadetes bacterium]|nr:molybdenum cofactor biosynthesis protein MoaD [Gemmatimonadota bacterium]
MARVQFTRHLSRYFPDLEQNVEIEGNTVAQIVSGLDSRFPGLAAYIVDDQGALRQHVNIFIGNELIRDRKRLGDEVRADDSVYVLQALSGG